MKRDFDTAMAPSTDVLVIGAGPGGLSAALTVARLHHTVKVFDNNDARNKESPHMTMMITLDGATPAEFRQKARDNLTENHKNVSFEDTEITKARKLEDGTFEVEDTTGKTWQGKKLVLATGSSDVFPDVKGYEDFWGKGIYHCYFYKGYTAEKAPSSGILAVDIMTDVLKSMHAARYATQISKLVTIYTNGDADLASKFQEAFNSQPMFKTDSRKIARFVKDPSGSASVGIEFEDGSQASESFIGHYPLWKAKGNFAEQLGLSVTPTQDIVAHAPWLQTDVRGVFACGDNSQMRKIIPEAQNGGSLVGAGVSNQIIADAFGQQGLV